MSPPATDRAVEALDKVVAHLPVGEERPGQREMCAEVAEALDAERHLLVEAGTGVGKSLAYLVPALLSGKRVVVATATKALQDQLVGKDIPFLREHLGVAFTAAVLKGRSNYLCLARLGEAAEDRTDDSQLRLVSEDTVDKVIPGLVEWSFTAESGERHDLPLSLPEPLWNALTVSAAECPGAARCPVGDECFAERARMRAQAAELVIVNSHLYCMDLALDGLLLGDHDAVVIDEAHTLEETAGSAFGVSLSPGSFRWLAAQLRGVLVRDAPQIEAVERLAGAFERALGPLGGQRVDPSDEPLAIALTTSTQVLAEVLATVRKLVVGEKTQARKLRVLQATDGLAADVQAAAILHPGQVAWVEGNDTVALRVAPVDVGPVLDDRLFSHRTVILTSATLSVGGEVATTAWNVGLRDRAAFRGTRVASPFDFRSQGLLYCATHLPDPRDEGFLDDAIAELSALIEAAGGRALALFTSYRAMHGAADALRDRWEWPVFVQDDAPRSQLLTDFATNEQACLFATMAFWQGVDVPGDALRLVVIDKLPFPRRDEPLIQARREAAEGQGRSGFETVDLPRAARLLAQGAGRLIRTTSDRGVVAVLDRRLATARYRQAILGSLPPLRRTVDRAEVREFLSSLG